MYTSIGGRELKGTESICWKAFADAMEVVPTTLAENAGLNPIRVVTDLRHRHVLGERNAAVSIRRRLGPGSAHAPAPARSIIAVRRPVLDGVGTLLAQVQEPHRWTSLDKLESKKTRKLRPSP